MHVCNGKRYAMVTIGCSDNRLRSPVSAGPQHWKPRTDHTVSACKAYRFGVRRQWRDFTAPIHRPLHTTDALSSPSLQLSIHYFDNSFLTFKPLKPVTHRKNRCIRWISVSLHFFVANHMLIAFRVKVLSESHNQTITDMTVELNLW